MPRISVMHTKIEAELFLPARHINLVWKTYKATWAFKATKRDYLYLHKISHKTKFQLAKGNESMQINANAIVPITIFITFCSKSLVAQLAKCLNFAFIWAWKPQKLIWVPFPSQTKYIKLRLVHKQPLIQCVIMLFETIMIFWNGKICFERPTLYKLGHYKRNFQI